MLFESETYVRFDIEIERALYRTMVEEARNWRSMNDWIVNVIEKYISGKKR